ncbi:MAG: thioredoxin domain-containing protein [Terriglobales bacterium]
MMLHRALFLLLAICLGCSAQSPPSQPAQPAGPAISPDLMQVVDREVRAYYALPPDVKVVAGPLRASEFPNYDALTIEFDGPQKKQAYEFLLSRDQKALIRLTRMDLTKDPYAEIMNKIDLVGRPTRGNKDAKVVLVNYDDFECPFCSRMHATILELFKEYGDRVRFVYKDYPLEEIHPWAVHAAVDANCIAAQSSDAYWDYADYLHANQQAVGGGKSREAAMAELDRLAAINGERHKLDIAKLQACVKAQDEKTVRASMNEGDAIGVEATPTIFVNGQKLDGAVPANELRAALDGALKDAGVAAPQNKSASADGKAPSPAPAN